MDGSAATSFAERTRSQISRAFANRNCHELTAQSELFEQLLNLKFTVQPPPEKQPTSPETPAAKSSSTVDKKAANKVDEEKDDESAVTVVALTPALPLVADKPVQVTSDQPATVVAPEDGTTKAPDLNVTQVAQPETASSVDPQNFKDSAATTDDQVIVADSLVADVRIDANVDVSDQATVNPQTDVGTTGDDSSSKKEAHAVAKLDTITSTTTQGIEETKPKESKETNVAGAQHEIPIEPKANPAQKEDGDDRRGDRREKWFEHKDKLIGESSIERPNDTSGAIAAQENSDPLLSPASEASQPALNPLAQSTPTLSVDTSIATPVALPATLSIVPQASPVATATPNTITSSNPESTSAVTTAPTRTIGHQTAKTNAKETGSQPGLSQQERVRVIQRIARSFNRISAEGGSINLRLHPEHLGSVSVQVKLEGRSLSARLSTETAAARDAIMQDLPALRQRLADQGFDVTKFQVDVTGNGADASFAQSNGQSQFGQSENRSSGPQADYRRVAAIRESREATVRQLAPVSSLNLSSTAGLDLQA